MIEELEIHLDKEFYTFLHARETSSPALPSSSVEIGNISSAPGNGKTDDNDINSVQLQETKKSTATKVILIIFFYIKFILLSLYIKVKLFTLIMHIELLKTISEKC